MATITVINELGEVDFAKTYRRTTVDNVRVGSTQDGIRVVVGHNYQSANTYKEPHEFTGGLTEFTFRVGDRIYIGRYPFMTFNLALAEQSNDLFRITAVNKSYQLNGEVGQWELQCAR